MFWHTFTDEHFPILIDEDYCYCCKHKPDDNRTKRVPIYFSRKSSHKNPEKRDNDTKNCNAIFIDDSKRYRITFRHYLRKIFFRMVLLKIADSENKSRTFDKKWREKYPIHKWMICRDFTAKKCLDAMIDGDSCTEKKYPAGRNESPKKSFLAIAIGKRLCRSESRTTNSDEKKKLIRSIRDTMDSFREHRAGTWEKKRSPLEYHNEEVADEGSKRRKNTTYIRIFLTLGLKRDHMNFKKYEVHITRNA